jgi:hypothetical protein
MQAITPPRKEKHMHAQEILEPAAPQNLLDRPADGADAEPIYERLTRLARVRNTLKKAVPAALLSVLVAGALSAAVPAIPAYASPVTLTLTAYPENSTGVPMVAAALTNHVLRGTPDALNMFVNGTLVRECKSRECVTVLSQGPGETAVITADVGPRGTEPYTTDAIVSATVTVAIIHHIIIGCHGTTCT